LAARNKPASADSVVPSEPTCDSLAVVAAPRHHCGAAIGPGQARPSVRTALPPHLTRVASRARTVRRGTTPLPRVQGSGLTYSEKCAKIVPAASRGSPVPGSQTGRECGLGWGGS